MATLATLVAPRLFSQVDKSKFTAAKAQVRTIRLALDAFKLDSGRYPSQTEGLRVLSEPPASGQWYGPYLDGDLPLDPWGNPYVYVEPERDTQGRELSPKVISLGADGTIGGEGDAADISS